MLTLNTVMWYDQAHALDNRLHLYEETEFAKDNQDISGPGNTSITVHIYRPHIKIVH